MAKRGTSRGFVQAVNKWTRETEERSETAFQNTILELFDQVRANTPVKTGNLRDAWIVSKQGQAISSVTGPGNSPDSSGPRSGVEQSLATILTLKIGDRASIMNYATYFRRLEYGMTGFDSLGRYYNTAGRFFARQVFSRYRSIARQVATSLRMRVK